MKMSHILIGCTCGVAVVFSVSCKHDESLREKLEKIIGDDPPPCASTLEQADDPAVVAKYAWRCFIHLNLPTSTDASQPVIWEEWRQTTDVYLPKGAKPSPWGTALTLPAQVEPKAKKLGLSTSLPFQNLASDVQADGLDLKAKDGQLVRYNMLMNRSTFDYIYNKKLYNLNGQEQLAKQCPEGQEETCINFDSKAMELKNSWIWLEGNPDSTEIEKNYFITNAYYQDPPGDYKVGSAALTGMHIITKPIPEWVWMTFENVSNSTYTDVKLELPISTAAQQANANYQEQLKKAGSILANYQLIGTQTAFVDSDNEPTLLANSQIESAFQRTSSCITCHDLATISKSDTGPLRFNYTDTSGGNVSYYVGNPPSTPGFVKMDFVWSLRNARRAPDNQ